MFEIAISLIDFFLLYSWAVIQIAILLSWLWAIWRFKIGGKVSFKIALTLLFLVMILTLFNQIDWAGKIAEYSFLFLLIGTIQEFVKVLRYEKS